MKKLPFGNWIRFWPVLALFIVEVWLVWANVKPGTWLVGWDNTMPELDFGLNFERIINAPWQKYRGLGVADGMAHAANLSHWVTVRLLALFLSVNYVRYGFVFVAHFMGMVGMYWLMEKVLSLKKQQNVALVTGLFYGLNPFVLQLFYAPLELFLFHYALLPWSIGLALAYLNSGKKHDLIWFGLVNLIGISQAHVPTVFMVYGLMLGIVALKSWRRGVNLLLVVLVLNLFWLMPYVVNLLSTTSSITQAKMNVMSTLETQLRNDAYGDFASVALMRSFNLDYEDSIGGKAFGLQFEGWRTWWDKGWIQAGLWLLFGVGCLGLFQVVRNRKIRKQFWLIGLIWLLGLIILGSQIPLLGNIYRLFRDNTPYVSQLLRFTFTKFGMMYAFGASLLFGIGIAFIQKKVSYIVWIVLFVLLEVSWPAFFGSFLYSKLRLEIPQNYFDVKKYLDSRSAEQRIVYLPLSSYWGWEFNDWNYRGSGFIWQMIKQPMLMRAFDPWSSYNETFYHELSTAFYVCPENPDEAQLSWCANNVKQVFDKYQVSLALLDETVILPGQDDRVMRYELWKRVLAKLDPEPDFASGFLSVYSVGENTTGVSAPDKYRQIEAETTYGRYDPYFKRDVAYVSGGGANFPFAGLSKENLSKVVEYSEDGLVKIKGSGVVGEKVTFPELADGDVWRGRIRATLSGKELKIELLPFGQLVVGKQHLPLWLDQRLEVINLPEALESVVIQVADKVKTVERDKPDEIWDIPMVVGEGLNLRVFEGVGELITIATPSARLGQLPENRLIQVDTKQKICLGYEQKNYQCFNQGQFLVTPKLGVYWFDALEPIELLPTIRIHRLVAAYDFPASMWQQVKREFEVEISDKKEEIRWEQVASTIDIGDKKGEIRTENCDVLKRGEASKFIDDGEVVYEAAGYGAYCHSWWVNPIDEEGMLRMRGENEVGRGLKLAVWSNKEQRTLLEQLLPSGGRFDQSYGLLTGWQQGATINVETKSFGRIAGKNRLGAVEFYRVPLTWLQKVKIGEEKIIENGVEILDSKKWGTGIYWAKFQIANDKFQNGLVALSQGFDQGWVGIRVPDGKYQITNYKLLPHVKVNGWANGWIVENANDQSQRAEVWILFWPQVMEWVGLVVLGMVVVKVGFDFKK